MKSSVSDAVMDQKYSSDLQVFCIYPSDTY